MAEPKTRANDASPSAFIAAVDDDEKRADAERLLALMSRVTGEKPRMWGASIVGFGSYGYIGSNGKENRWPMVGFSPRKQNLTVYIMPGFGGRDDALARLGPHSTGVSCLYVKRLADVDADVLAELVRGSVDEMRAKTKNGTVPLVPVSAYASSDVKRRRDAAKKSAAKKSAAKNGAAKRGAAKKSAAKKSAAKKGAAKKSAAKKSAAKKGAAKKGAAKKSAAKKSAAKTAKTTRGEGAAVKGRRAPTTRRGGRTS